MCVDALLQRIEKRQKIKPEAVRPRALFSALYRNALFHRKQVVVLFTTLHEDVFSAYEAGIVNSSVRVSILFLVDTQSVALNHLAGLQIGRAHV